MYPKYTSTAKKKVVITFLYHYQCYMSHDHRPVSHPSVIDNHIIWQGDMSEVSNEINSLGLMSKLFFS